MLRAFAFDLPSKSHALGGLLDLSPACQPREEYGPAVCKRLRDTLASKRRERVENGDSCTLRSLRAPHAARERKQQPIANWRVTAKQ